MPKIQVYDPALCCSTGVCGVEVDQQLVGFAADADWVKKQRADIERFNLAQQPLAFAGNSTVKKFLERSGQEGLPLILVDGDVALAGRYPQRAELAQIDVVTPRHARRYAVVPLQIEEPVGVERLLKLAERQPTPSTPPDNYSVAMTAVISRASR